MTLVFDRIDDGSGQTHALVIGVGGYKHLFGGSDPKNQVIPQIGVLKQLTTAPRSAIAFAEFLIETQDQWRSPLGSVELLYSTPPEDDLQVPADFDAQGAAFAEIQEAYDAWRERCDKHQDNIAVLYFCGHGVEKEEQYLLAEDFGKSPGNPWLGSFAIDSTQLAFWACKAQTQCFFIDACREITDSMKEYDITVLPLETPNFSQPEADSTMIMKATAGRETALGPKKGVAYCTQALIRGFRGDAADQDGSGWVVRSGIISDRITRILRRVKNDQAFRQRCPCEVTKSTELLRLPDGPIIRAWQLLLEAGRNPTLQADHFQQARERLLEATRRGFPLFTEGLRRLRDGLLLLDRLSEQHDTDVRRALLKVGAYTASADWSSTATTFLAAHPDPDDQTVTPEQVDQGARYYIYDVPISDMVAAGAVMDGQQIVAPGPKGNVFAKVTLNGLQLADGQAFQSFGQMQQRIPGIMPWQDWTIADNNLPLHTALKGLLITEE